MDFELFSMTFDVKEIGLAANAVVKAVMDAGGPALRKMSFHERAAMLKALGQYLMERKETFYAL